MLHCPILNIAQVLSESSLRNGCKTDQGYKTKINKLLQVNETSSKVNQKEKRELHLTNNRKNKILIARSYASKF
jgi:hypothetical protein